MNLATTVLYKARSELAFFTFVFVISMFAFSQLFYVQLGSVMERFNTQTSSIVSLTRSLFGDFDIVRSAQPSQAPLQPVIKCPHPTPMAPLPLPLHLPSPLRTISSTTAQTI